MIYIIIAMFMVTYFLAKPIAGRRLNLRETGYLFVIYLCTGLIIRSVLFVFGM